MWIIDGSVPILDYRHLYMLKEWKVHDYERKYVPFSTKLVCIIWK